MKILGAIIAGGNARRFGSDKAHALFEGRRMIDRVADALKSQTDGLIVCGRNEPEFNCIADRPQSDMGPLGGINAALSYATDNGYDAVLSTGCDVPNLPGDMSIQMNGNGPAIVTDQPVVGFWPVVLANQLDEFLASGGRQIFQFAKGVGAREIVLDPPLLNINRPEDLPD